MEKNRRKIKFIKGTLQGRLMLFIFLAAIVPTAIVAVCLYYIIFNMLAYQIGIPEAIASNLMPVLQKVNFIILIAVPVVLTLIWMMALELSHRIVGPIYRLEKELDLRISGRESGPIRLRQKDELKSLADKINKLLNKR